MAVLYITEYSDLAKDSTNFGLVQAPQEPPVAEQTVAIGGSTTQSSAFNAATRFVRLHTDAICSVEFGTNPTATATKSRMAAGTERLVGVPVNTAFKVAVITNT